MYWFIIIIWPFIFLASSAYGYKEIKTPHFIFHYTMEDERLAKSLINKGESFREEVEEDLGIYLEERIRVYIAPSFREYKKIQPAAGIPIWSVGVAYPDLSLIIIKSPRAQKKGHIDIAKVFKHELTHIILGRAFKGRKKVPRWLHEGLAMYISREWNFSRVSVMTRAVLTNTLIPLSSITHSFPREAERAALAYSESFYLISFLISKYGKDDFHRFIKVYSGGSDLKSALLGVYGIKWENFEGKWKNYLKIRFSWIPIFTSTTTLWFLVTMLFILGYLKKRRLKRLKFEEWEIEEND